MAAAGKLGRRRARGACRAWRLRVASAAKSERRPDLHDRSGAARQPELCRHRQRHAAADALGQHRQRAVGHGRARAGRRQRSRQERPGAGRARHCEAARPDRALARVARRRAGEGRADGCHSQRGARQPRATRGSGAPVGRQGTVEGGARHRPRCARARAGRRSERTRDGGRCTRRPQHRRDESVEGVDPLADRRRGAHAHGRAGQRGRGLTAGRHAVHDRRRPDEAAPCRSTSTKRTSARCSSASRRTFTVERVPEPALPGGDHACRVRVDDDRQRRHLRHGPRRRQRRPRACAPA